MTKRKRISTSARKPITIVGDAVRRERERNGITAAELAKRSGLAKSTLSQLEAGAGNPSIETLWAVSAALGVPVSKLIDVKRPSLQIIRAGEGPSARSSQSDYKATLLSASPPMARRDVYRIEFQPGSVHTSNPHPNGTIEHVILLRGRARVGPLHKEVVLQPGDCVVFAGDVEHVYEALKQNTSAIVIMEQV